MKTEKLKIVIVDDQPDRSKGWSQKIQTIVGEQACVTALELDEVIQEVKNVFTRRKEFRRSTSRLWNLLRAFSNLLIIYSDMMCYIILVLNHMISFNVLSSANVSVSQILPTTLYIFSGPPGLDILLITW